MKSRLDILLVILLGLLIFPLYAIASVILGEDAFEWWDERH